MNSSHKYRPYFTASELTELIEVLKTHSIQSPSRIALTRYLEGFAIKINNGVIESSLQIKGSKNAQLVAALDLDNQESTNLNRRKTDAYDLYMRWMNKELLTPPQLEIVMKYRYEKELMTQEEENKYEHELLYGLKG